MPGKVWPYSDSFRSLIRSSQTQHWGHKRAWNPFPFFFSHSENLPDLCIKHRQCHSEYLRTRKGMQLSDKNWSSLTKACTYSLDVEEEKFPVHSRKFNSQTEQKKVLTAMLPPKLSSSFSRRSGILQSFYECRI